MTAEFKCNGGNTKVMLAAILLLPLTAVLAAPPRDDPGDSDAPAIDVTFSPGGGCGERIIAEIDGAKKTICMQAYIFTSRAISDALVAAKRRGVAVEVILDKSQEKQRYGRWPVMRRDGVKVRFDRDHEVANSKIILIDGRVIITGSYNFTKAAEESNAENVLIIRAEKELFSKFQENYDKHREHSSPA